MIAVSRASLEKKGDHRVLMGFSPGRRALLILWALGTCLLPPVNAVTNDFHQRTNNRVYIVDTAPARAREGARHDSSAGSSYARSQTSTIDKDNTQPQVRRPKATPKPTPKPTPKAAPKTPQQTGNERPQPTIPTADPDIFTNITLNIKIRYPSGSPDQDVQLTLWSADENKRLRQLRLNKTRIDGGYSANLKAGLDRRKSYWVSVDSADRKFSGEAPVTQPKRNRDTLTIPIDLHPTVAFEITVRDEDKQPVADVSVSVLRKNEDAPGSSIPRVTGSDGSVEFSKGVETNAEYVVFAGEEGPFDIDSREIEGGKIRKEISLGRAVDKNLLTIRTADESAPVRGAKVTLTLDDASSISKNTDEKGEASFPLNDKKVQAVEVRHDDYEDYYCGRESQPVCPSADENGVLTTNLKREVGSGESLIELLKSAVSVAFVGLFSILIIVGALTLYRMQSTDSSDIPRRGMPVGEYSSSQTARAAIPATVIREGDKEPEPSPSLSGAPNEIIPTVLQPGTPASTNEIQTDSTLPPAGSYSVPTSLSMDTAKEAYKRLARREKLSREPAKLELMLNNNADNQRFQFKETKDPGSKFILFTDGDSNGWLFPNPAPSVLQTEVEQTWRLVFQNLTKDEFERKKERLNPRTAQRVASSGVKGMWTAEPGPCQFD